MNYYRFILLFYCIACLRAQAQDVCQTRGNFIRSVGVNDGGEPVVEWSTPDGLPSDATGYVIYSYVGGAHCTDSLDRAGLQERSYIHAAAKPLGGRRAYSMAVATAGGNKTDLTRHHAFSWLEAAYDSCRYAIDLQWTAYEGWDRAAYNVYGGVQGTPPLLLAPAVADVRYALEDVPDNVDFVVYVEAVNVADPSVKSASNRVTVHTRTLQRPAYMAIRYLRHADRRVQLDFDIDPATQLSAFRVMRSRQAGGTWTPVHTFSDKTLRTYTDEDVRGVYYYRLSAENRCGTTAAQSAILNSMELLAAADNGVWHVSWTRLFLGRSYSLSRLEPAPQQLLATAADTAYADRIDPSHAALRYCYRVEAVTDDGAESTAAACADYTPEVLMPDATDPKSTVQNPRSGRQRNQFGPVLFIDPSLYAYRLEIYNRHGARIAAVEKTAADAPEDKSWNGTDAAGGFVPEDMYLYRVELTFVNGESAVKTGNVAVIYGWTD